MRIVIDTNVLVSAAKSKLGASYKLVSLLPSVKFEIALTLTLYVEWQAVLTRSEHMPRGVQINHVMGFLRYLVSIAHLQDVYFLWRPFLRDPSDDTVLECAVSSGARYIVTHNTRDFQRSELLGIKAMTPLDFLKLIKELP